MYTTGHQSEIEYALQLTTRKGMLFIYFLIQRILWSHITSCPETLPVHDETLVYEHWWSLWTDWTYM